MLRRRYVGLAIALMLVLGGISAGRRLVAGYYRGQRTQGLIDDIETAISPTMTGTPAIDAPLAAKIKASIKAGALANGFGHGRFGYFGDVSLRETPLHVAADWDLPLTCQVLLDAGADPNALDSNGYTPLVWAIRLQDPSISSVPVVRVLLKGGADPNVRSPKGWTSLDYAAEDEQRHDVGPLLRKAGARHSNTWTREQSTAESRSARRVQPLRRARTPPSRDG